MGRVLGENETVQPDHCIPSRMPSPGIEPGCIGKRPERNPSSKLDSPKAVVVQICPKPVVLRLKFEVLNRNVLTEFILKYCDIRMSVFDSINTL